MIIEKVSITDAETAKRITKRKLDSYVEQQRMLNVLLIDDRSRYWWVVPWADDVNFELVPGHVTVFGILEKHGRQMVGHVPSINPMLKKIESWQIAQHE